MDRPTAHVSQCAVSLAWLERYVEEHQIRAQALTTGQVVFDLVVPATAGHRCRFADLLLSDPEQRAVVSRGRPFYFVSHAWGRPFAETLDMVARHFRAEEQRLWRRDSAGEALPVLPAEETFVWFDVFAINQHADSGQQEGDLAALREVVCDAEATLMVMDPEGSPLTRIWCLYEAWQTGKAAAEGASRHGGGQPSGAAGSAPGTMAAGGEPPAGGEGGEAPGNAGKLRLLSYDIPFEQLKQVFIDLEVAGARATKEEDRARILADIAAEPGGLHAMTHRLKAALVDGGLAQVPGPEEPWTEQVGLRVRTAASLCQLYGRLEDAERLFRRDVRGAERATGPDSGRTLAAVRSLSALLFAAGRYAEAEALVRRDLEGCERRLGPDDPETLEAANNLGLVLKSEARYGDAEPLLRRVLGAAEHRLGASDPYVLSSASNLAWALEAMGRYEEAGALYRRALAGGEKVLGPKHPDTLLYTHNLAGLLHARGGDGDGGGGSGGGDGDGGREAEALFRRAVEGREKVLGACHPDTLASVHNLANLLVGQERLAEAEPLCRRALEGAERAFGPDGRDTLVAANSLGKLLQAQGKLEEARPVLQRALDGLARVLGQDHPDALSAAVDLADLLLLQDGGAAERVASTAVKRASSEAASPASFLALHGHAVGVAGSAPRDQSCLPMFGRGLPAARVSASVRQRGRESFR